MVEHERESTPFSSCRRDELCGGAKAVQRAPQLDLQRSSLSIERDPRYSSVPELAPSRGQGSNSLDAVLGSRYSFEALLSILSPEQEHHAVQAKRARRAEAEPQPLGSLPALQHSGAQTHAHPGSGAPCTAVQKMRPSRAASSMPVSLTKQQTPHPHSAPERCQDLLHSLDAQPQLHRQPTHKELPADPLDGSLDALLQLSGLTPMPPVHQPRQ